MQEENLIPANEFCLHHNIEVSFIDSLKEYGLVEFTVIDDAPFVTIKQLTELEKLVRLRYELDINLEGIDAIIHLLKKLQGMQDEIIILKNKLRLYEASK
jgi:hypothetical protein